MRLVHLHVHTPWSYLDGASSIHDLLQAAASLEMPALAITDHNSVSAAVRFHQAASAAGIKPITGSEVSFAGFGSGGPFHLTLLATGPQGYANLCAVLTRAHLDHERGTPLVTPEHLANRTHGLIALSGCRSGELPALVLRRQVSRAEQVGQRYVELFGRDNFFIELQALRLPHTHTLNRTLSALGARLGVGTVATNNVHYAQPNRFPLHDLLTCVRTGTTLPDVHPARPLNAEAYLKSATEMTEVLSDYPQALAATAEIAARCVPVLQPGAKLFPRFVLPPGSTAAATLREQAFSGAIRLYGTLSQRVQERLEHELRIITNLDVADYFLVVSDIVAHARHKGIRFCGRGSAANSLVAHVLGISEVDALERGLLFERFLSLERANMPDIDIDIESDHRDEIIDYVFARYGQERAAMVCTFSTYQSRSVIRDFGKALGFPADEVAALAKSFPHVHADHLRVALAAFPELRNGPFDFARYQRLFEFGEQVAGFPRHVSTHLGGVVISRDPITQVSPLQMAAKGVPVVQFDKNDVEELGLLKLDLLSLRTLSAVQTAVSSVEKAGAPLAYDAIPPGDTDTFSMLRVSETVGVFQLESPSQRALQAVLDSESIADIVASIALIRPGPVRGNMVSPFIKRHQGLEEPQYADPRLQPILEPTYGVVLYQEQVLQIAMEIAGFTAGEADKLRRAMSDCRSEAEMRRVVEGFSGRAVSRGCAPEAAAEIATYLLAYAGYGFCQGHAEAFAATAYKTAYLLRHFPAHYLAALMSRQPLGFYPTHTLCVEAKRRGIRVLRPDINLSGCDFSVTDGGTAIRTSLRQVRKANRRAEAIVTEREAHGPYTSLADICRRLRPDRELLECLVLSGACDGFDTNRKRLLWSADLPRRSSAGVTGSLFPDTEQISPGPITDFTLVEKLQHEQRALGFTVTAHPLELARADLKRRGFTNTARLAQTREGSQVRIAGLVVRPQRPPTRSGKPVVFFTLEDEFGLVDITVFERIHQRDGRHIFTRPAVEVSGRLERRGRGLSVTADAIRPLSAVLLPD